MLTPLKIAKLYNIYGVRIEDFHLYSIATLDVFTYFPYFPYPNKIYELLIALTDTHENKPAFVYMHPDSGASGLVRKSYHLTTHLVHDKKIGETNGL